MGELKREKEENIYRSKKSRGRKKTKEYCGV
jgi:hypothetical protein